MPTRTYYWDFFGPRAQRTAEHFLEHLRGFLEENSLDGCETGLSSESAGHAAAFCVTPERHQTGVERALKPRRSS